jgi:hypothetical protein
LLEQWRKLEARLIRIRALTLGVILALGMGTIAAGITLGATGGGCGDNIVSRQADADLYSSSAPMVTVDAAFAYIAKNNTYFYPCGRGGVAGDDGASAWVSLQPGPGNPQWGSPNAIAQIGIVSCDYDFLLAACDSTPNVFWASGGCNGFIPWPGLISGTDPGSGHYFEVRVNWSLQQVEYYGPDGTLAKTTSLSDPTINCWASAALRSAIAAETSDRGDSLGGSPDSQTIRFTHLQFHSPQTGWRTYGDFSGNDFYSQYSANGDSRYPKMDFGNDGDGVGRETWMRAWTVYQP